MKLTQLEKEIKRKEEKEKSSSSHKTPVILTPGKSITINLPDEERPQREHTVRKYGSVEQFKVERKRENNFLRSQKCPECFADVSIDHRGDNIFWYQCQRNIKHNYLRVGLIPSVTEEDLIESYMTAHNID